MYRQLIHYFTPTNFHVTLCVYSPRMFCGTATTLSNPPSSAHLGYGDLSKDREIAMGLYKQGQLQEALKIASLKGKHDPRTMSMLYVSILKACGDQNDVLALNLAHAHIVSTHKCIDLFVTSTLISMYAKCGCLVRARRVFDGVCKRDVVVWNAMIAGYAKQGQGAEALFLFDMMKKLGFFADRITFLLLVGACASLGDLVECRRVHDEIVEMGFESDPFVASALVDMYGKCGCLTHAQGVFDKMVYPNVVAWTSLIGSYARTGHGVQALALWHQMKQEKVKPNKVTFICLLNACASVGDLKHGKDIHLDLLKSATQLDVRIGNSLMDMYSKCGSLALAYRVFSLMHKKDAISWTTLIAGCVTHGKYVEAVNLFEEMKFKGVNPLDMTFACIFNACGCLAALEKGKYYHSEALEAGLDLDVFLGDALIDMYSKCGDLERARGVFDEMQMRDVVSWTAMITGYSVNGEGMRAFHLFRQMQQERVRPNEITFLMVLSTCAYMGLLEEGCSLFNSMQEAYGITPSMVHHGCVVDLLCRVGCLYEANEFINNMAISPDVSIWMTLLSACNSCGCMQLAESVFERILELKPQDVEPFVLMSNIYAAAGEWHKRTEIRRMMDARGALS